MQLNSFRGHHLNTRVKTDKDVDEEFREETFTVDSYGASDSGMERDTDAKLKNRFVVINNNEGIGVSDDRDYRTKEKTKSSKDKFSEDKSNDRLTNEKRSQYVNKAFNFEENKNVNQRFHDNYESTNKPEITKKYIFKDFKEESYSNEELDIKLKLSDALRHDEMQTFKNSRRSVNIPKKKNTRYYK